MKPKRVLLVDDNRTFLRAAERFLRGVSGLELVGQTTSGEKAAGLIGTLHPDLVLMDIALPGMNGLEATRQIKRQHDAVKVIIVTLHKEPRYRALAKNAGADGFILKDDLVMELPRLIASLFPPQEKARGK